MSWACVGLHRPVILLASLDPCAAGRRRVLPGTVAGPFHHIFCPAVPGGTPADQPWADSALRRSVSAASRPVSSWPSRAAFGPSLGLRRRKGPYRPLCGGVAVAFSVFQLMGRFCVWLGPRPHLTCSSLPGSDGARANFASRSEVRTRSTLRSLIGWQA